MLKKKVGKWPILDQNDGLTPWEKCQYCEFLNFLLLERQQAFFFVLEYPKRHFPGLNCLKKKSWKNGTFGPKPWVNPLGKMSIFRVFEALVFIA